MLQGFISPLRKQWSHNRVVQISQATTELVSLDGMWAVHKFTTPEQVNTQEAHWYTTDIQASCKTDWQNLPFYHCYSLLFQNRAEFIPLLDQVKADSCYQEPNRHKEHTIST